MRDLRVRMVVEAEAAGAQAALRETEARLAAVGEQARGAAREADRTVVAVGKVGQSSGLAAGQVANLAAQFNDIGQMLAAGQSPLMLAMQQGTQIAQVLGPMGAAGAVRALGAAIAAVFSPINLLTIGAIAAGAALAQWLGRALEDAERLETALEGVNSRADALAAAGRRASASVAELRREFGDASGEARKLLRELEMIALREAERGAGAAIDAARRELTSSWFETRSSVAMGNFFGLETSAGLRKMTPELLREINAGLDLVRGLEAAFRAWDSARAKGDLDAMVQAAGALRERFREAAEAAGGISADEDRMLRALVEQELALIRVREAAERVGQVDMASGVAAAVAEARTLVGVLDAAADAARGVAAAAQARLREAQLRLEYAGDPVGLAGALERDRAERAIPRYGGPDAILRVAMERQRQQALETAVAAATEAARLDDARRSLLGGRTGRGGGGGGANLAGRAAEAMRELDFAVAAVNEKVRAGLLSTSEGAEAVAGAKRRAAEALADLIPRLEAMGPAGRASAEAARSALAGLAAEAGRAGEAVRRSLVASFEESFARALATGRDAMSAFADHVQMELARAFTRRFVTPLITPIIDSILGAFAFGRGGVISGGVQTFATGGIVAAPTLFPMRGAVGLMGEAGPEAIMPLAGGRVRALAGQVETTLPLARAASGHLAVDLGRIAAFATGGVPAGLPGWASRAIAPAAAPPAAQVMVRPVRVEVHNHAGRGDEPVEETRIAGAEEDVVRLVIGRVKEDIAQDIGLGRGPVTAALTGVLGARRRGR